MVAVPDRYARCSRQLINLWQTKEERKEHYDLARSCGFNSAVAARMRDWRPQFILRAAAYYDASIRVALERQLKEQQGGE